MDPYLAFLSYDTTAHRWPRHDNGIADDGWLLVDHGREVHVCHPNHAGNLSKSVMRGYKMWGEMVQGI